MIEIHLLDHSTIDKIAAGEVVERPASVVKELVENAVDAGADSITVEIKEGGTSFIRVTDNGCGIDKSQIEKAFTRHATSKIKDADDLVSVASLGFRGEALSSIAAVSKVELITKTKDSLMGVRYVMEGSQAKECEDIGAPEGTTILVRNLFFNTPVRKNFLRQPATEGGYVSDLMEHMALSKPNVSFKYIINGQVKFHTTGGGDIKEIIYRIFGRDIANELVFVDKSVPGMRITGFLGKPSINRSNRNFENYFVNGRYIKSTLIAKAIEEGYKGYLMQHKFPFAVLHFNLDTEMTDVNVHPTKMDIRFHNREIFSDFTTNAISEILSGREMIPEVTLTDDKPQNVVSVKASVPEPFETRRMESAKVAEESEYKVEQPKMQDKMQNSVWTRVLGNVSSHNPVRNDTLPSNIIRKNESIIVEKPVQMELFDEKILSKEARSEYKILGQIFDTYWLISYQDKLMFMDQHAAHEKVKYENFIKAFRDKTVTSQLLNPPIVITLTGQQEQVFLEYEEVFASLGFEAESFGGDAYALRAVPSDLYGCNEKEMFESVLDELGTGKIRGNAAVIEERIASMSCKAAVKGNMSMSLSEVETLLDQLLQLENPYHCPHGRPTVFTMSKYEIEKKFKRIV